MQNIARSSLYGENWFKDLRISCKLSEESQLEALEGFIIAISMEIKSKRIEKLLTK